MSLPTQTRVVRVTGNDRSSGTVVASIGDERMVMWDLDRSGLTNASGVAYWHPANALAPELMG